MYCPGENCSIRNKCANHFADGQIIDWSEYGYATCGFDKEKNYYYYQTYRTSR